MYRKIIIYYNRYTSILYDDLINFNLSINYKIMSNDLKITSDFQTFVYQFLKVVYPPPPHTHSYTLKMHWVKTGVYNMSIVVRPILNKAYTYKIV